MEMEDVRYHVDDVNYDAKCEEYFISQYRRRIDMLRDNPGNCNRSRTRFLISVQANS